MISDEQREIIKPVLGNRFSKEVKELLESGGKKAYSAGFISNVLNGNYENEEIEGALIELYDKRLKEKKKLDRKKKNLLKIKPEAVTPGSMNN